MDLRLRDDGRGNVLKQLWELLRWVEATEIAVGARVLGVHQDGIMKFARRRPRLIGRLSRVVEKHAGILTMIGSMELQPDNGPRSSLDIGPGSDDAVGSCREFVRRFAEGIGKLAGNMKEDHREKPEDLPQECQRLPNWRKLGLN
ncbi:hypothetical protein BHE74_00041622 [Ensete ventricosum]|nr:hypothetical protein GW17_00034529 [Ensete ventricosum]RWW51991.1 hypothetical protein BHE74_00041622 [Ensete ventricosum]